SPHHELRKMAAAGRGIGPRGRELGGRGARRERGETKGGQTEPGTRAELHGFLSVPENPGECHARTVARSHERARKRRDPARPVRKLVHRGGYWSRGEQEASAPTCAIHGRWTSGGETPTNASRP